MERLLPVRIHEEAARAGANASMRIAGPPARRTLRSVAYFFFAGAFFLAAFFAGAFFFAAFLADAFFLAAFFAAARRVLGAPGGACETASMLWPSGSRTNAP